MAMYSGMNGALPYRTVNSVVSSSTGARTKKTVMATIAGKNNQTRRRARRRASSGGYAHCSRRRCTETLKTKALACVISRARLGTPTSRSNATYTVGVAKVKRQQSEARAAQKDRSAELVGARRKSRSL
jgi:hypothetical protein